MGHVQTQEHVQVSLHYTFTIIMGSPTQHSGLKIKRLMLLCFNIIILILNPRMYKVSIVSILILHIFCIVIVSIIHTN